MPGAGRCGCFHLPRVFLATSLRSCSFPVDGRTGPELPHGGESWLCGALPQVSTLGTVGSAVISWCRWENGLRQGKGRAGTAQLFKMGPAPSPPVSPTS